MFAVIYIYIYIYICIYIFFYQGFLSRILTTHRTAGEGRRPSCFTLPLPPVHEHSDIYLQLCTWDDYHIFNRNACIYQTATRWDLPPYRVTVWLIDGFVCLLVALILGFVTVFDRRNRWTRTRIDYHPCITSQPTNQVF